jgi:dTDP-4-amino-4,6-dideoxygalactose transaminase
MKRAVSRRHFIQTASVAGAGLSLALPHVGPTNLFAAEVEKPVKLGGKPACTTDWPGWPVVDATEENALSGVLKSKRWFRGSGDAVAKFEDQYAKVTGAKHCLATASGTAALSTVLGALDLGPGDEVIIPPYTFVATYNVITLNYALPVFADVDLETFQVDPRAMARAITKNTAALMPVHIGGSPADLDAIIKLGADHKIPVIEDACQAHMAEWRGKKVGTLGLAGCFSFQASKNLNSGEGGAVLTNDRDFAETCYNFHNQGRARAVKGYNFTYSGTRGSNLRLSEFQGGLLTAQMTRLEEQTKKRNANAAYLTSMLKEIPGIKPAKLYDGVTASAFHLYMFRFDPAQFGGLDRGKFMSALAAEGVPASSGYGVMNRDDYVSALAKNKHFLKIYGDKRMNEWLQQNQSCPQNQKLCEQAVWFTQTMLLADRSAMEQIAAAIRKIQRHASALAKA